MKEDKTYMLEETQEEQLWNLTNPDEARKAFIASEIFERKY